MDPRQQNGRRRQLDYSAHRAVEESGVRTRLCVPDVKVWTADAVNKKGIACEGDKVVEEKGH